MSAPVWPRSPKNGSGRISSADRRGAGFQDGAECTEKELATTNGRCQFLFYDIVVEDCLAGNVGFHLLIGCYDPARFARRRTAGTRRLALYIIGRPGFQAADRRFDEAAGYGGAFAPRRIGCGAVIYLGVRNLRFILVVNLIGYGYRGFGRRKIVKPISGFSAGEPGSDPLPEVDT